MPGWPLWLGDLPTWITTLAVGVAVAHFLIDRKRRAAEEERESKAQATGLSAWTVTDVDAKPRRTYGVVIANTSASTFHDVRIHTRLHRREPAPIRLDVLPPGTYFIQHNGESAEHVWEFAVHEKSYGGWLRPYMKSGDYRVTSIDFSDNLDQSWRADQNAVLTRTAP